MTWRDVNREKAAEAAPKSRWSVMRHGGRYGDRWRDASPRRPWGADEHSANTAKESFRQMHLALRQGGVALIDPEGNVVGFSSGPTLRTRW